MDKYYAVTSSGTKEFLTPFAAASHLNKLGVAGTVEMGDKRVKVWERKSDGSWLTFEHKEQ